MNKEFAQNYPKPEYGGATMVAAGSNTFTSDMSGHLLIFFGHVRTNGWDTARVFHSKGAMTGLGMDLSGYESTP